MIWAVVANVIGSVALIAWVSWVAPRWSADTVPLGVRVPTDRVVDPVVLAALRRYRRLAGSVGLAFVVVAALASVQIVRREASGAWLGALAVVLPLVQIVATTVLWSRCGEPIRAAKAAQGWYDGKKVALVAAITDGRPVAPVPWRPHLLALGIAAATVAYGLAIWDSIPDVVVTHTGPNGPDAWAPKSYASVFAPLGVGVGLWLMVVLIAVWYARRPLPALPEGDIERARRYRTRERVVMQRALAILNVAMMLTFALISYGTWVDAPWAMPVGLVVAVLSTPVILVLYVMDPVLSEGRAARTAVDPESPDDDRYWRWGGLYVNPEDPRISVPKRMGLGDTINLGHPIGRVIMLGMALLLVGCAVAAIVLPLVTD